jgi:hypothetical protein
MTQHQPGQCNVSRELTQDGLFSNCSSFCSAVANLSAVRQGILVTVRNEHPIARISAERFDWLRGRTQAEKVRKLKSRSCDRILMSVDRANTMATGIAACFGLVSLATGVYMHEHLRIRHQELRPVLPALAVLCAAYYFIQDSECARCLSWMFCAILLISTFVEHTSLDAYFRATRDQDAKCQ